MKKARVTFRPKTVTDEIELRRWCIEQAIRWPTEQFNMQGVYSGGGAMGPRVEVDIIGRADRLLKWVRLR